MNTYRYFSDLHGYSPDFKRDSDSEEICILAGDVTEFGKKGVALVKILKDMCLRFKEVIFVPGNHEYYGTNIGTLESKVRLLMKDTLNFTLLQDAEYIERDGVRIIGATMWSDTSTIEFEAMFKMNDYKYIRFGPLREPWRSKLKPGNTTGLHRAAVYAINKAIKEYSGECIVVTHHAPSYKSIDPRFEGDSINPAYYTELELDQWPTYWIHGHIHIASDYDHNGCNVLCNPGGYQSEYTNFEPLTNSFTL